ncbi:5-methyltetrahydropteroyltriglutamate--homocysteine S-methyltransferase [Parenemella sanctibonifatiensis]|uniref:5-methyltetrahydropteroyltriglutamate--homocysteine methyltransferase n=1 Tax=Parenemella sanctibonifatiensis TaxID=2016505 RepID=A0A255E8P1_9ACTN|nr:5-methyltetrahydropteroyltriglutamate--homocysteine S-methyltransferase [Parenemella sanctibonifatiensis]OYN87934.1 5-methyltetrahydropteroyltriglutamate--homocysteine S-methyltransferase [Parenemella sanctibonifatiensis]
MTTITAPSIGATVLGYPRIGRDRELKRALEAYWAGRADHHHLLDVGAQVRQESWKTLREAGLTSIPIATFSHYDQVLDTSVLLGVVPDRFPAPTSDDAERRLQHYFAMARGTDTAQPLEMTKWFDTNYHYLVPEIGPDTTFTLDPTAPLADLTAAGSNGTRPVIVGPWTYLACAKTSAGAPEGFEPLDRLEDLLTTYVELLTTLHGAGAEWVQLDEPALVRDLSPAQAERVAQAYARVSDATQRPAVLVATYFGHPREALAGLAASNIDGIALDLTRGGVTADEVAALPGIAEKALVLGAVDGRNVWRTDLRGALTRLEQWRGVGREIAVSTSCSLLHVPYDVSTETALDPALRSILAFADQKLAEVVALQRALDGGVAASEPAFAEADAALANRSTIPGFVHPDSAGRLAAVSPQDRSRGDREDRAVAQRQRLQLPPLPTTTIGSFPQTSRVRQLRADHRAGRITTRAYTEQLREEVRAVVDLQEDIGLDVLVHGEPERNDMVQYFAEQLQGYAASQHGWVQSYGSRCVRPPILFGDVHRPAPMTVAWTTFAQSLTQRPMKGMLTGPVTMLAWSFVRDDQPRSTTADQVALALRDEVADLEAAGIAIIQVDEPALRETLPLREAEQQTYLNWAVGSFRLATSGVREDTQIHTHLCYSEFGEIIDSIDALGADVTSIEAARSGMELLADVGERGFRGALGPGVYDIHSPRVPATAEIEQLLRAALASLPAEQLWVNPDCGLKTRSYEEVLASLRNLTTAARQLRTTAKG